MSTRKLVARWSTPDIEEVKADLDAACKATVEVINELTEEYGPEAVAAFLDRLPATKEID